MILRMKNLGFKTAVATALLVMTPFLSFCGPKSSTPQAGPNTTGGPASTTNSNPTVANGTAPSGVDAQFGTTDTGGDNGLDGKTIERYKVDPKKLAAYSVLAPLFSHIDRLDDPNNKYPHDGLSNIFELKTWYVAPVDFKAIEKHVLGIEFIQTNTIQIAIQAPREIWISGNAFNAKDMTLADQAQVILHEWVMNLYLMKFAKSSELCKMDQKLFPDDYKNIDVCKDEKLQKAQDQFLNIENLRPLDKTDYAKIRAVTVWLYENRNSNFDYKAFYGLLATQDFAKILTQGYLSETQTRAPDVKISAQDLFDAINGTLATKNLNQKCISLSNGKTVDCSFTAGNLESLKNPSLGNFHAMKLSLSIEGKRVSPFKIALESYQNTPYTFSSFSQVKNSYMLMTQSWIESPSFGSKFYFIIAIFEKRGEAYALTALGLKPAMITAVHHGKVNACTAQPLPATDAGSEAFVAANDSISQNELVGMLSEMQIYAYGDCF